MTNFEGMKIGSLYRRRARVRRLLNYTIRTGELIFDMSREDYEKEMDEIEQAIAKLKAEEV